MIFDHCQQADFSLTSAENRNNFFAILSRFSVNLINLDQIIINTLHLIRIPE